MVTYVLLPLNSKCPHIFEFFSPKQEISINLQQKYDTSSPTGCDGC